MPLSRERTPREQETLIFERPHEAWEFTERIEAKVDQTTGAKVHRPREIIAEAVSREFERHGEAVGSLSQPWEHTVEEHQEAKKLVDLAFAQDLEAALKQARVSHAYPRNIDLLHDALTREPYELLVKRGMNRQAVVAWPLYAGLAVMTVLSVILVILILV